MSESETLTQLLTERSTIRAFTSDRVERTVINKILADAGRSPSWCNTQPWTLYLVDGDSLENLREAARARLSTDRPRRSDLAFPETYDPPYDDRRRAAGRALYTSLGISRGDREASRAATLRNFEFFGAPTIAIVTSPKSLGIYGAIDCGFFTQSLALSAHAHGLGTAIQGSIALLSDMLREQLGIPLAEDVLFGICIGYPDRTSPVNAFRTDRSGLESFVRWID